MSLLWIAGQEQVRPVREGDIVVGGHRVEDHPVALEFQLADHFRRHQGDDVGEARDRVARPGVLADSGAPEQGALFQDQRLESGPAQVGSGSQPVMASPHHYGVESLPQQPAQYRSKSVDTGSGAC